MITPMLASKIFRSSVLITPLFISSLWALPQGYIQMGALEKQQAIWTNAFFSRTSR
jgi:hypothetical protein